MSHDESKAPHSLVLQSRNLLYQERFVLFVIAQFFADGSDIDERDIAGALCVLCDAMSEFVDSNAVAEMGKKSALGLRGSLQRLLSTVESGLRDEEWLDS